MMYPFMTLNDDTEITHSEMKADGRVKVYIETPDVNDGFHNATCWLPEYRWEDIVGYSETEMAYFRKLIQDNAHLIMEFSQEGGILNAANSQNRTLYYIFLVHVHIAEGRASANATKLWITRSGKAMLCNNNSKIPERVLNKLIRVTEANSAAIIEKWLSCFGEIRYFC